MGDGLLDALGASTNRIYELERENETLRRERDELLGAIEEYTALRDSGAPTAAERRADRMERENEALREALGREIALLVDEAAYQRRKEEWQVYEEKLKHGYAADLLEEAVVRLRALTESEADHG